ncbi:MAG TPA: EAL domain-containing protein, partial [Kiloniellaceae bacterium]|nr:EAL domain-containing protein [Kiloniellaceae bacterium]
GVLLGLLVLLSAGLLHEYAARLARQDRTVKQLLLMARGFSSLREEVFDLRARLEGVGTTLVMPAVPRRVPGSARTASPPQGLAAEEQRRLEQVIADAEGRADAKDGGAKDGGTAGDLAESEVLATLRRALTEQRVDLYLQPVVALPQRKRTAYECFSRLRSAEGFRLLPEQFIALAERRGLIAALDSNLLSRAVQLVRKVQGDGEDFDFFCNVSGQSLARQDFLRSLADSLARNRVPARNLVFELSQADLKALEGPALMGLRQITQLGCRLSMDRVTDLDLDPEALADVGVDFVKLGADLVLSELAPGHRLLHALGAAGLQVVVEKVESEEALKALADYDLALAQGYLFSMPRLARPAA